MNKYSGCKTYTHIENMTFVPPLSGFHVDMARLQKHLEMLLLMSHNSGLNTGITKVIQISTLVDALAAAGKCGWQ